MKILFVTPVFVEKNKPTSGMPNYIYRTAMFLHSLGHECYVIAGANCNRREVISGIIVYRVNVAMPFSEKGIIRYLLTKIIKDWQLQKKVKEICNEKNIEIIQYAGHSGTGMFHNPKKLKTPAVMRMSTYTKYYYACYENYKKELCAISRLEEIAVKRMNSAYAPSRVIANALEQNVGKKIGVIESTFYNEIYEEDDSIYNLKLAGMKYFLYFGGLDLHKGIFVISAMLSRLLNQYEDFYFVFCGADPQGNIEKIQEQNKHIKNRIIWLGAQSHSRLYPILRRAELIVLPSLMENLSNACMEAMYFGKLVVATDGTSYEQLIEDGINGFLAEPGNSESLYDKVCEAMALTLREKEAMSDKAKERINQLRPEITIKRLIHYYENVIANQQHGRV